MEFTKVILTADIIIEYEDKSIILVKRKHDPYKGQWALPGGMMDGDETIHETAVRETKEETALDVQLIRIVGIYSAPDRDPRGRYVSVTFVAKATSSEMKAGDDAGDIIRTKDYEGMNLAFDHNKIIADYLNTAK